MNRGFAFRRTFERFDSERFDFYRQQHQKTDDPRTSRSIGGSSKGGLASLLAPVAGSSSSASTTNSSNNCGISSPTKQTHKKTIADEVKDRQRTYESGTGKTAAVGGAARKNTGSELESCSTHVVSETSSSSANDCAEPVAGVVVDMGAILRSDPAYAKLVEKTAKISEQERSADREMLSALQLEYGYIVKTLGEDEDPSLAEENKDARGSSIIPGDEESEKILSSSGDGARSAVITKKSSIHPCEDAATMLMKQELINLEQRWVIRRMGQVFWSIFHLVRFVGKTYMIFRHRFVEKIMPIW